MNKVFLTGNLTRDPELSETSSGISVCRFSIAVNRRVEGEQVVDFYNVTAWRGLGETIARYASKGKKVAVLGNIELNKYEDKDGIERTGINIIAQDVEFLSPKAQDDSGAGKQSSAAKSATQAKLAAWDGEDGDIPF